MAINMKTSWHGNISALLTLYDNASENVDSKRDIKILGFILYKNITWYAKGIFRYVFYKERTTVASQKQWYPNNNIAISLNLLCEEYVSVGWGIVLYR